MFIHNIDPVLVNIFGLQIRYYGLVYALGLIFLLFYLRKLAKEKKIKFSVQETESLVLAMFVGLLVGARLFYAYGYNFMQFFNNPLEVFYVWQGGMSFHGGLIGSILGVYFYCRYKKQTLSDFFNIADYIVLPSALFLFFGRIANFINGELVGKITALPWGVKFPGYEGFRHPSQLYEALLKMGMFYYLFSLIKTKNKEGDQHKNGYVFWMFILLYGFGRFFVNFFREPTFPILGLDLGQWLSLVMGIFALGVLIKFYWKKINLRNVLNLSKV